MSSGQQGIASRLTYDRALSIDPLTDRSSAQGESPGKRHTVSASACRYVGSPIGTHVDSRGQLTQVFECHHADHAETTVEGCAVCSDFLLPSQSALGELIPEPSSRQGEVCKWSVGVTTAPRPQPTLTTMLDRLTQAGWKEWTVFAEPNSDVPRQCQDRVCWRRRRMGAWPNFYLGLAEMFMTDPDADAYLMLQDDAFLCQHNVREYLESILWPQHPSEIGFLSLYTSAAYARPDAGWYCQNGEPWRWGALAIVFPQASVRSFLSSALVVNHRLSATGRQCTDFVLGDWSWHMRLHNWIATPSLVQHAGDVSSIRAHSVNDGFRRASVAVQP